MTIEKCKDFVKDGYGTWDDTSKPTTYANMYDFMKNQNNIVMNLASGIWQPSTSYAVGTIIRSPSLPAGCVATCTTAGTSGTTEPKWTAYGTTVTDGSCKWKINTNSQDTLVSEMNKTITIAINSLHNTIKSEMKTAMLALFPVGTILETTNSANPSTYIGGTWEQLGAGLTTITAGTYKETHNGTEDTYVFTAGRSNFTRNGVSMTGEAEHVITEGELAKITPSIAGGGYLFVRNNSQCDMNEGLSGGPYWKGHSIMALGKLNSFGKDMPHNNLPPIYCVFRFRRAK